MEDIKWLLEAIGKCRKNCNKRGRYILEGFIHQRG